MDEKVTPHALEESVLAHLFSEAHTAYTFSDRPVSNDELLAVWELAKWPPTSWSLQPMRVVYVQSETGRARLGPHMSSGNRAKTISAPAVAILAADTDFHETIPTILPDRPEVAEYFTDPAKRAEFARFNATLQAGYFILAVRAIGLAAGPMLGFKSVGIDAEFFPDSSLQTILVVNIGHPGDNAFRERLPRLDIADVVTWA